MKLSFEDIRKKYFKTLIKYVEIVDRVHGDKHPEFHQVRTLFERIYELTKEAGSFRPHLASEFKELREVTNNYQVPSGVCETYSLVYKMLEEADEAYLQEEECKDLS